ncbi:GNAT family N-acetyltransferase [Christensenellaceae bacterium NSJ-53]|uniref:GNAT family N-acetyltransferase n=1 Tax=Gehongia tenuis TaxID=2763655 RepID=A0A926D796_9FIRM|nr:GNAT family N-acetyltransferase [Gehongia tenuis]
MSAVYMDPDFQGRGLAQMLLERLEKERPDIRLKVPKAEAVNRHIYEKMGYRNTGRETVVNDRLTLLLSQKHT